MPCRSGWRINARTSYRGFGAVRRRRFGELPGAVKIGEQWGAESKYLPPRSSDAFASLAHSG